ncbi:MAG TPA: hypothetical protein VD866_05630 [Urbifossiella sp.]|nr:hypothetical protein [Urbifossiella sp.]
MRLTSTAAAVLVLAATATGQPPAPNAALQYWLALDHMPRYDYADEAARKIEENWRTVPFTPEIVSYLEKRQTALKYLHRGAEVPACVWPSQANAGRDGFNALTPQANTRSLAHAALFRARYRFEHGHPKAALDDVFATIRLARHVGSGGVLGHTLERHYETAAVQTVAAYVWALGDPAHGRDLLRRFDALPRPTRAADAVRAEQSVLVENLTTRGADFENAPEVDLLGRAPERLRENRTGTNLFHLGLQTEAASVRRFVAVVEREAGRAAANARLPLDQVAAAEARREADYLKNVTDDDPNVRRTVGALVTIMPVYGMRLRDERGDAARAMLRAAVEARLRGDDTPTADDPHGAGPFARTATPTGYQLRTALNERLAEAEKRYIRCDGPLTLIVHTSRPRY